MRCLGHPFTDAQFETVREVAGEKVELAQFKKLHAQLVSTHKVTDPEADLKVREEKKGEGRETQKCLFRQAAFAAMDSDKTGKISKKMLKHFLTSVGEKLSAAEADALLQGCPDNVDYAAFKKAVLGL